MVCSSDIPPTGRMSTAAIHHDIMVHLARGHIQGSPVHPPAWEYGRGWDLANVWAKSRALFLYRLQAQDQRDGSLTAGWLKKWNLHSRTETPPPHFKTEYQRHWNTYAATLWTRHTYHDKKGRRRQRLIRSAFILLYKRCTTRLPPHRKCESQGCGRNQTGRKYGRI